jgi:hypothetical protein
MVQIGLTFRQGCQMVDLHTKIKKNPCILEGLGMENAGLFFGHLVFYSPCAYFIVIWYILWPFWYVVLGTIWQPCIQE